MLYNPIIGELLLSARNGTIAAYVIPNLAVFLLGMGASLMYCHVKGTFRGNSPRP